MRPYYQDGSVTIYLGDCREVVPALGVEPDLTMADPPYAQTSLAWDQWPEAWPSTLGFGRSLWCFGSLRMFMQRALEFEAAGWHQSQDVVWEKHNGSSFHADRFRRVHEQAAHFYKGEWGQIHHVTPKTHDATARSVRRKERPRHMGHIEDSTYTSFDGGPRQMRSVIYARSMHGLADNETQKPEGIVAPLIEYGCPVGGLILSPFCGSGTDLEVAALMGRRAIGIDTREQQCEVAAKRLSCRLGLEICDV
jgi:site-specific DNA-methyltransferase (adenine-specific)